jgi:hypothetical protein
VHSARGAVAAELALDARSLARYGGKGCASASLLHAGYVHLTGARHGRESAYPHTLAMLQLPARLGFARLSARI